MAVTANQVVKRQDGCRASLPVYQSNTLYEGTLAFVNSTGYGVGSTGSGVNAFAGVVVTEADNASGASGDVKVELHREGVFQLVGSGFTQADVGKLVYATDNFTIGVSGSASGAVCIGKCVGYVSTTKLLVELIPAGAEAGVFDTLSLNTSITSPLVVFNGATGANEVRVPDNLADALSIKIAGGADLIVLDSTDTNEKITILSAATQKLGFFGTTPVVQGSAYTQTYATADKTHANPTAVALTVGTLSGTANGAMEIVGNTMGGDVSGAISNNFQELFETVNALIVDVADVKALVNSVIDDLQAFGLVA